MNRAEVVAGQRAVTTTADGQRIADLERECGSRAYGSAAESGGEALKAALSGAVERLAERARTDGWTHEESSPPASNATSPPPAVSGSSPACLSG